MKWFLISLVFSQLTWAISPEDADKFVKKYELMVSRVTGFMNCVSRALTGENAIEAAEGDLSKISVSETDSSSLLGCFRAAGYKTKGLEKLMAQEKPPLELPAASGKIEQGEPVHSPPPISTPQANRVPASTPTRTNPDPLQKKTRW